MNSIEYVYSNELITVLSLIFHFYPHHIRTQTFCTILKAKVAVKQIVAPLYGEWAEGNAITTFVLTQEDHGTVAIG